MDLQWLGKIETSQDWIQIGDTITGIYLSPSFNIGSIRDKLTELPATDNIIGDANCIQRYKRRALLDMTSARGLTEKPVRGNTWRRWHRPQDKWVTSKPDIVFSFGNWITKGTEWTISDHAIIYGTIPSHIRRRKLLVTDWEAWMVFVEGEEKDTVYPDPMGILNHAAKQNLRTRKYSPKPWWDFEIKEQRKVARRAGRNKGEWRREAAKLRNMIKQKKREHWSSFVEETTSNKVQDIWKVIKVARNPFNRRDTMPATLAGKDIDE